MSCDGMAGVVVVVGAEMEMARGTVVVGCEGVYVGGGGSRGSRDAAAGSLMGRSQDLACIFLEWCMNYE